MKQQQRFDFKLESEAYSPFCNNYIVEMLLEVPYAMPYNALINLPDDSGHAGYSKMVLWQI